jgi:signal recognition particle subunit SRP54
MFESLGEKLQAIFKNLKRKGKLNEKDVDSVLREVRLALLEADVSLIVVKDFTKQVKEKAVGQEIWNSLTPAQLVIKLVKDQLTEIMGSTNSKLGFSPTPPTILMLIGLQGSGKTTSVAKLAIHLKKQGKNPLMVAADIYRPAAIHQLEVLGEQLKIPVFSLGDKQDPVNVCAAAVKKAATLACDVVIIDTAGRLHIDEELMDELKNIKTKVCPHEILLVVDSMIGQESVNVAKTFEEKVGIDGVILTKMDGDARGGAALSVKSVTGKPIKFVGIGEKTEALEPFFPDRMASRILGMGDVLSLIEKAEATFDAEKVEELEEKIRSQTFNLEDFLQHLQQVKNMGPLDQLVGMIPGLSNIAGASDLKVDEKRFKRLEAIIYSMTREERRDPEIIRSSRKKRIATGSGNTVAEVNQLLKQFKEVRKMLKHVSDIEKVVKKKGKGKFKLFN